MVRFLRSPALLALVVALAAAIPARAGSSCYAQDCDQTCGSSWSGFTTLVAADDYPDGNDIPIAFVDPADGLRHRLLATHEGKIWNWDAVSGTLTSYLDLTARVLHDGNERGLLALAVDPEFETSGDLYVYYTGEGAAPGSDGDVVLERYARLTDVTADPGSNETILVLPHANADNHNGGSLVFGPDGMLYVSTGDGGGGCDSTGPNAQALTSLKGKLLRIDVRQVDAQATAPECGSGAYEIPSDNPLAGVGASCGEIWVYGLRNPFRFTFDRANGDLWTGDVGQNSWEEVNWLGSDYFPLGAASTANFGWRCREGCDSSSLPPSSCTTTECSGHNRSSCVYDDSGFRDPVLCHDNRAFAGSDWQSVIGGYRYRGSGVAALSGRYVYGDAYCGQVWRSTGFDPEDPAAATAACWHATGGQIYSFAEDSQREIYVLFADGRVRCIHPEGGSCPWADDATLFDDGFESGDRTAWTTTQPPEEL